MKKNLISIDKQERHVAAPPRTSMLSSKALAHATDSESTPVYAGLGNGGLSLETQVGACVCVHVCVCVCM